MDDATCNAFTIQSRSASIKASEKETDYSYHRIEYSIQLTVPRSGSSGSSSSSIRSSVLFIINRIIRMSAFARNSSIFEMRTPSKIQQLRQNSDRKAATKKQPSVETASGRMAPGLSSVKKNSIAMPSSSSKRRRQAQPPGSCISFQVRGRSIDNKANRATGASANANASANASRATRVNSNAARASMNGLSMTIPLQNNSLSQLTMSQLSDSNATRPSFTSNNISNTIANNTANDTSTINNNAGDRMRMRKRMAVSSSTPSASGSVRNRNQNRINARQLQSHDHQKTRPASAYAGNIFFSQTSTSTSINTNRSERRNVKTPHNGGDTNVGTSALLASVPRKRSRATPRTTRGNSIDDNTNKNKNKAAISIAQSTPRSNLNNAPLYSNRHQQQQQNQQQSHHDRNNDNNDNDMEVTEALKSQPLLTSNSNSNKQNIAHTQNASSANQKRSWMASCMNAITTPYRKKKRSSLDNNDATPSTIVTTNGSTAITTPAPVTITNQSSLSYSSKKASVPVSTTDTVTASSSNSERDASNIGTKTYANPILALTSRVLTTFQTPARSRKYGAVTTDVFTDASSMEANGPNTTDILPSPSSDKFAIVNVDTKHLLQQMSSSKQEIEALLQQLTIQKNQSQQIQEHIEHLHTTSKGIEQSFQSKIDQAHNQGEALQQMVDHAKQERAEFDTKVSSSLLDLTFKGREEREKTATNAEIIRKGMDTTSRQIVEERLVQFQDKIDGRFEDSKRTTLHSIMESLRSMAEGSKTQTEVIIEEVTKRKLEGFQKVSEGMVKELEGQMKKSQIQAYTAYQLQLQTQLEQTRQIGQTNHYEYKALNRQSTSAVTPTLGPRVAPKNTIGETKVSDAANESAATGTVDVAATVVNDIKTKGIPTAAADIEEVYNDTPRPIPASVTKATKAKASVDVRKALNNVSKAKEDKLLDRSNGQNTNNGNKRAATKPSSDKGVVVSSQPVIASRRTRRKLKRIVEPSQPKVKAAPIEEFELPCISDREKLILNISPLSSSKSMTRSEREDIDHPVLSTVNAAICQEEGIAANSLERSRGRYNLRPKRGSTAQHQQHAAANDDENESHHAKTQARKEFQTTIPITADQHKTQKINLTGIILRIDTAKIPKQQQQRSGLKTTTKKKQRERPLFSRIAAASSQNPTSKKTKSKTRTIMNAQAPNPPDECTPVMLIRKELSSVPPTSAPKLRHRRKKSYQRSSAHCSSSHHHPHVRTNSGKFQYTSQRSMLGSLRLSSLNISEFDTRMQSPPTIELCDGMKELTAPKLPVLDGRRETKFLDMRTHPGLFDSKEDVFEFA